MNEKFMIMKVLYLARNKKWQFFFLAYVQHVVDRIIDPNFLLYSKHHPSKHLPGPVGGRMYFLLTLA